MSTYLFNYVSLAILSIFISNKNTQLHGREIARKLNKNQRTIQLHLENLYNKKILSKEEKGKNYEYSINKENPQYKQTILLTEISKNIDFLNQEFEIASIINDIKELTNDPILIFGSYAKGYNNKESDIDTLIITEKKINANIIQHKYTKNIHIITMTKASFESSLKKGDSFPTEVLRHHILCQGFEYFIHLEWR